MAQNAIQTIDNQINQLEEFKSISSKAKIKEYEIAIKYFTGLKELLKDG